jgi:hypothetical protein
MLIAVMAASCSQLDVVGTDSKRSFNAVLDALPGSIAADEMNAGWSLAAPDGGARFIWSADYSKSPLHDIMLEVEARPFLDAGLDPDRLPEDIAFYEDKLMVGTKLGNDQLKYSGAPTPFASYEQLVTLYRKTIGYHAALDHYGVSIGEGNLFEWAKDMGANDKDIVFVLNPEPFIKAGVNPNAVQGWVFAKVPVDINGKAVEVDKFLKPFNVR